MHVAPPPLKVPQLEGPPGFPPLFPELSLEEQKMAMLYISHADETERRARIERVRQGIAENARESAMRMAKITTELDKGKGHVYLYPGVTGRSEKERTLRFSEHNSRELEDTGEDGECSDTNSVTFSAPAMISTGFQLGPSSEGRVSRNANSNASKGQRKRPSSWKRKLAPRNSMALVSIDALVDLTLSVRDLINVNEGTWNIQRVREVIAEEDVGLWQKPPLGVVKCNISSSWTSSSNIFGSAWIARDSLGTPLFHSRRAFPAAASTLEADLYTLGWAVNALHDLHFQRVIIEISSPRVLEALFNPAVVPTMALGISRILRSLKSFAQCQLLDAPVEVNSMAVEIASSVTRDRRLQSYVAKGGPSWLSSFLLSEARSRSI
ncbi:hypothetical protein HID58_033314 [Brassica napus]|uniref:RNase H type-1 domain-containing protein n=1 Tax=Brassica napus TaxID=3708 RepID=A0ABQ8BZ32_BRANA|nr:hypothetical protein HID58_033314 [Brassica napus]